MQAQRFYTMAKIFLCWLFMNFEQPPPNITVNVSSKIMYLNADLFLIDGELPSLCV